MNGQVYVSSYHHEILRMVDTKSQGAVPTSYGYNDMEYDALPPAEVYTKEGAQIFIDIRYMTPEVVEECHKANQKIGVSFVYIPEKHEYYRYLISIGVDCIISDHPLELMAFIESELQALNNTQNEFPLKLTTNAEEVEAKL